VSDRYLRVCPTCDGALVASVTGRTRKTPLGVEVFSCPAHGPTLRWGILDVRTGEQIGHADAEGGRLLRGLLEVAT
jgi:hypothetical protein